MPGRSRAWCVRRVYEFIKAHSDEYDVKTMCRVLDVARGGYYAWLQNPVSKRVQEDARLLRLIRASYKASHGVYGARRIFLDLREAGETCSKHRVERLMRQNNIRALHGYRTRYRGASKPSATVPDLVKRNFDVIRPNKVWVTDITYIRTWAGLALFGRRDGSLLETDRRLVDGRDPSSGTRSRCHDDGSAPSPRARHRDPFRPGLSIWQ